MTESRLQALYDSGINATFAWFHDHGFAWYLGDNHSGFKETGDSRNYAHAVDALCVAAAKHFPDTPFAKEFLAQRDLKTAKDGIDLITEFEGLELEAYQDIAGVWTIGYGHTETAKPGMRISAREANELLLADLATREQRLNHWMRRHHVLLHQSEFDALMSFIYNVGFDAFQRSTAARRIRDGDMEGAADALTWWNKATVKGVLKEVRGLTRRRAAERELFLSAESEGCVTAPGACADIEET